MASVCATYRSASRLRCSVRFRLYRLLGGLLLALATVARAEVVAGLYEVAVPVAEQGQSELQRAAATGLREVAVRITGRSGAANEPALAPLFANAVRYLDQYRYERGAGADAAWIAQLRFSPSAIDAEMRKAGLPSWGPNRPALITAIAVEDNGARTLVDANSPLASALLEQYRRRGLALHWPAGAINAEDVARLDIAKVSAVAQARLDGWVLGRVVPAANGGCQSSWQLALGAQTFTAEAAGASPAACIGAGLDRIFDNFSAQYAVASNAGAEGVILRVTGIARFEDYAALLSYLRRLIVVKNAQPLRVLGDEILLQLKIAGSPEQLARQLALENRLAATENIVDATIPAAMSYRWQSLPN